MLCLQETLLEKHLYLESRGSGWSGREGLLEMRLLTPGRGWLQGLKKIGDKRGGGNGATWELMDGKVRDSHDLWAFSQTSASSSC